MAFSYRASLPPYAISPEYGIHRPVCLYVPSPVARRDGHGPSNQWLVLVHFLIVDYRGFTREYIKHRGARILDLSQRTGSGLTQEEKWINYINVLNSIKPWRAAGKPFVCDRLWLWTS